MTAAEVISELAQWANSYTPNTNESLPGLEEGARLAISDLRKVLINQNKKVSGQ